VQQFLIVAGAQVRHSLGHLGHGRGAFHDIGGGELAGPAAAAVTSTSALLKSPQWLA
jgi:hypothetical protein